MEERHAGRRRAGGSRLPAIREILRRAGISHVRTVDRSIRSQLVALRWRGHLADRGFDCELAGLSRPARGLDEIETPLETARRRGVIYSGSKTRPSNRNHLSHLQLAAR